MHLQTKYEHYRRHVWLSVIFIKFAEIFDCLYDVIVLAAVGGHHDGSIEIGIWIITGLLTFMVIEKIFPENDDDEQDSGAASSDVSVYCSCQVLGFFCVRH